MHSYSCYSIINKQIRDQISDQISDWIVNWELKKIVDQLFVIYFQYPENYLHPFPYKVLSHNQVYSN